MFIPGRRDPKELLTYLISLEKKYDFNKLHLGFIGRISREKNITQMIQAVAMLNQKNISVHFLLHSVLNELKYVLKIQYSSYVNLFNCIISCS